MVRILSKHSSEMGSMKWVYLAICEEGKLQISTHIWWTNSLINENPNEKDNSLIHYCFLSFCLGG